LVRLRRTKGFSSIFHFAVNEYSSNKTLPHFPLRAVGSTSRRPEPIIPSFHYSSIPIAQPGGSRQVGVQPFVLFPIVIVNIAGYFSYLRRMNDFRVVAWLKALPPVLFLRLTYQT
jgi:hypothetical protein